MAGRTSLTELDAAGLLQLLDMREVSATEVVRAHLDRVAEYDDEVHAFLNVLRDQALAHAADIDNRRSKGYQVAPRAVRLRLLPRTSRRWASAPTPADPCVSRRRCVGSWA